MAYSFSDFGGIKTDYDEIEDISTDRTAQEVNQCFASVAASCTIVPNYIIVLNCITSTDNLVVAHVRSQYPNVSVSDITCVADGDSGLFYVTLPTSVIDQMGATITTSIEFAGSNYNKSIDGYIRDVSLSTDTNVINVQCYIPDSGSNESFRVGDQLIINIWTT